MTRPSVIIEVCVHKTNIKNIFDWNLDLIIIGKHQKGRTLKLNYIFMAQIALSLDDDDDDELVRLLQHSKK